MTADDLQIIHDKMVAEVVFAGGRIDRIYYADSLDDDHPHRKPNPGMLLRAGKALTLDLNRSWLVGDKASDIAAARNAGLAGAMLVLTGYGSKERTESEALVRPGFDVRIGSSISDTRSLPIFR